MTFHPSGIYHQQTAFVSLSRDCQSTLIAVECHYVLQRCHTCKINREKLHTEQKKMLLLTVSVYIIAILLFPTLIVISFFNARAAS